LTLSKEEVAHIEAAALAALQRQEPFSMGNTTLVRRRYRGDSSYVVTHGGGSVPLLTSESSTALAAIDTFLTFVERRHQPETS